RIQHVFERDFVTILRERILGRVLVRLHRDLGEVLQLGSVFAHMLDAGLAEHRGHKARAELAFGGVGRVAAAGAPEQPLLAHLLDAHRHRDVVHPRRDGHIGLAECGGAGRAGVGDVDDRNAGLADLLQNPLPDHRIGLVEIAAGEHLDVLDGDAGVLQRDQRRFAAKFRNGLLGIAPELDHPRTEHVDIWHFQILLAARREAGSVVYLVRGAWPENPGYLLGLYWNATTSCPSRSLATTDVTNSTGRSKIFLGSFCASSGLTSTRLERTLTPSGRSTITVR